jgi:hypothetical protein
MTLEDLRMHMTLRAWKVLCAHMDNQTTVPLLVDTDGVVVGLHGVGRVTLRQIHKGLAAYEWQTYSHPLCTEP